MRDIDGKSVEALAGAVFDRYGACHLLFNNAGVTSGGGGLPWEQEPNDWRWCFGVNVFGVANGVLAFVPRMIASGEEGVIVNTSSGDGGIAPVPYASVYAEGIVASASQPLTRSVLTVLRYRTGRAGGTGARPRSPRRASCASTHGPRPRRRRVGRRARSR
jgi:NAD(P)-dependent dehydrogenase (short-subunit alcohol dehydrogenase family)